MQVNGGGKSETVAIAVQPVVIPEPDTTTNLTKLGELKEAFENPLAKDEERAKIAASIVDTISSEARKEKNRLNDALGVFNHADYQRIAKTLSESSSYDRVLTLARIHERQHSSISFAGSLVDPLLYGSEELFLKMAKPENFGASGVIELLAMSTASQVNKLTPAQAASVLKRAQKIFMSEPGVQEPYDHWSRSFEQLRLLRLLDAKLEKKVGAADSLLFIEALHDRLEQSLKAKPESAQYFLRELRDGSLDAAWLKLSVLGRKRALETGVQVASVSAIKRTDRILKARLTAAFASPDAQEELRQTINSLCDTLEGAGIKPVTLSSAELKERLVQGLTPGCYEVSGNGSVHLRAKRLTMSPDSVVRAKAMKLDIEAESFVGSFIDLSAPSETIALAAEANNDPEANAIAFPMIVGFKTTTQFLASPAGVHYFVVHHLHREAKPGKPATKQAKAGLDGGNLSIEVQKHELSRSPVFVSIGQPGQTGAPPRAGGAGDRSEISVTKALRWVRDMDLSGQLSSKGEKPKLHLNPSIGFVKDLFEQASRSASGEIEIYVLKPEYLGILEPEQRQKIERACHGMSLENCFSKLGKAIFKHIEKLVSDQALLENQTTVPAELISSSYAAPAGSSGPVNADGAHGSWGGYTLQGFSQE